MPKGIYQHKKLTEGTRKKLSKQKKGKNNPRWKGGITKKNHCDTAKYKELRRKIFQRDNFTCLICKKMGGNLECHHLKEWAKYPELRFNINNCITLCENCHKNIHKRMIVNKG